MGAPLDPMVKALLVSAEVDTTLSMPSQFRLVFRGPRTTVLEGGGLQLAAEVMLQVTVGGTPMPLMSGEITAVEVDYGPDGNLTIVRGLDRSHRLMKGTKTMAYPDMTASDAVTALVAEAGLIPGEIIPTTTIYPWLTQANVSAWVFIQQMAALENCVAYMDAMGLFNFGPMTKPEEGLPPVMTYDRSPGGDAAGDGQEPDPAAGQRHLLRAGPRDQRPGLGPDDEHAGHGDDPGPAILVAEHRPGHPAGGGGRRVRGHALLRDQPARSTARGGDDPGPGRLRRHLRRPGRARRAMPRQPAVILAGESISLGMAGPPFDGQYIVSSARHVFDSYAGGYTTWFTVGGRQDRSLLRPGVGRRQRRRLQATRPEVPGVVLGTVVDNMDDGGSGAGEGHVPLAVGGLRERVGADGAVRGQRAGNRDRLGSPRSATRSWSPSTGATSATPTSSATSTTRSTGPSRRRTSRGRWHRGGSCPACATPSSSTTVPRPWASPSPIGDQTVQHQARRRAVSRSP